MFLLNFMLVFINDDVFCLSQCLFFVNDDDFCLPPPCLFFVNDDVFCLTPCSALRAQRACMPSNGQDLALGSGPVARAKWLQIMPGLWLWSWFWPSARACWQQIKKIETKSQQIEILKCCPHNHHHRHHPNYLHDHKTVIIVLIVIKKIKKVYDDCHHCHHFIFHLAIGKQGAQT